MVAVSHDAIAPPNIVLRPNCAISFLLSGAIPPIPPSCMTIEAKFANAQRA